MALLYGATGATDFAAHPRRPSTRRSRSRRSASALVVVGFTFKISAVPFHQWTPDVYEGAPTSVTAFMSVTVKVAAFAGLMRIVRGRLRRRRRDAARRALVAGRRHDDRRQRDGRDPGEREAPARLLERRARGLPADRPRRGHAGGPTRRCSSTCSPTCSRTSAPSAWSSRSRTAARTPTGIDDFAGLAQHAPGARRADDAVHALAGRHPRHRRLHRQVPGLPAPRCARATSASPSSRCSPAWSPSTTTCACRW